MITQTDLDLAARFLPDVAQKKDIISKNKIKGTAKVIGAAMEPERIALRNLVNRLKAMAQDQSFKDVWKAAAAQGVTYQGETWKTELEAAQAIVDTYPVPDPTGD